MPLLALDWHSGDVEYVLLSTETEAMLTVVQLVAADANGEKVVHSSPASDMWALGVLAYEMFAGYGPAAVLHNSCHTCRAALLHPSCCQPVLAAG